MTDGVSIDTSSFTKFARDLKEASPELRSALRIELKAAGELVAEEARALAGFSSRIPGAIKVSAAGNAIKVYVLAKKAPNAKPLEHGGKGGTFRHPVFGDRDVWVSQQARPFLWPALMANKGRAVEAAKRAVDRALRKVHSHG